MRFLFIFATLAGLASADVIVMKNGDRVTGSVVKKDADKVTVKSALFGTVTLPWDQVQSITTDNAVNAELANGQAVQGKVTTAGTNVVIGTQTVAPADVKALRDADEQKAYERLQHPGWLQLWSGSGTIGWAGTSGNAQTSTFSTGITAARTTRTDKTTIYFNSVRASAKVNGTKSDTAQAVRGGWGYSRDLTKKIYFSGFNDWEYDRFQALDLRGVFGGGVGYHLWKSERGFLDIPVGLAYSHAKFDPFPLPKYTTNSAELYWGDDFNYKANARINFTEAYRMFNNLSNGGEYRQNFDVGATTQLTKWLNWNLAFSDRYLSNPAPGRKTNDLLYTTGLGINFSH